jgi:RES domain-containing protein
VKPVTVRLPDGRVWLRVADPAWRDPLNPAFAGERGGRWNPPGSHATLYLNADVATARAQIERMLAGTPVRIDDLDNDAYLLVAARLPRSQTCADATTGVGLRALGLAAGYPLDSSGQSIPAADCEPVGVRVREEGLRGVWCRSA